MRYSLILFCIICSLLFIIVHSCTNFKSDSRIRIRSNGYVDILIAIDENVDEDHLLIERIKEAFIESSDFLFNITKKRVYFRQITIVIPSTWKLEHYYDDFNSESYDGRIPNATWQTFDRGDFCIDTRDYFTIDTPLVVNYASGGCGRSASHMSLTAGYFLNKNRATRLYGPYSKVLIHNWAKFRYGVFDEHPSNEHTSSWSSHPSNGDAADYQADATPVVSSKFYLNQRGEIEATRCGLNLAGVIKNPHSPNGVCNEYTINGLPSSECSFQERLDEVSSGQKQASLMYKPFLADLNEFCDNTPENANTLHNRLAPTVQNMECGRKSVWEVMRSHDDFIDYKNMPNQGLKTTIPKFQLLKHRVKKVVMLVDRSLFNQSSQVAGAVERAIKDYVKLMLSDGHMIGIIHFENFAKVAVGMTLVRDSTSRKRVLTFALPARTTAKTKKANIWNAVSLGLSLLKSGMDSAEKVSGGRLLLITSSTLDDKYPNRKLIMDQLKSNQVILDVVKFNTDKDELLDSLVQERQGVLFHISEQNPLMDIDDSLMHLSNRETSNQRRIIELLNTRLKLSHLTTQSSPRIGHIHIDRGVSHRTDSLLRITFHITNITSDYLEIVVKEPSGRKHESKYNVKCKDSSLFVPEKSAPQGSSQEVVCEFRRPREGQWTYEIMPIAGRQENVRVVLKASVFFYQFVDENSYYSNYYERDDYDKRKKRQQQTSSDDVTQKPVSSLETDMSKFLSSIKLEAKWKHSSLVYPQSQVLYASLSKGMKPILNASVKAFIYRPGGIVISLELRDDGLNEDRFQNDGIYTRQFSNFDENGLYHARIEATSNEFTRVHLQKLVGSFDLEHYPSIGITNKLEQDEIILPIEKFQRTINLGHFVLNNFSSEIDLTPPSRIKDLRVIESDLESKVVKIVFTAPGDDSDLGTAIYYDIKCSYDLDYLIDYEDEKSKTTPSTMRITSSNATTTTTTTTTSNEDDGDLVEFMLPISLVSASFKDYKPNQGGSREYFVLNTDIYSSGEDIVGIKIRAADASGNLGQWSNLVTIKLNSNLKFSANVKPATDGAIKQNVSSAWIQKNMMQINNKLKEDRYFYYFIIFIICLSLILLVQILMIVVLTVNKFRRARKLPGGGENPSQVKKVTAKKKKKQDEKDEELKKLEESLESNETMNSNPPVSEDLLIRRV